MPETMLLRRLLLPELKFGQSDMCDPFRTFARRIFPNAVLVADKFHVLRLLSPSINRHRRLVEGDRRSATLRRLLLCSRYRLEYADRPGARPVAGESPRATRSL
jgi:transposase